MHLSEGLSCCINVVKIRVVKFAKAKDKVFVVFELTCKGAVKQSTSMDCEQFPDVSIRATIC